MKFSILAVSAIPSVVFGLAPQAPPQNHYDVPVTTIIGPSLTISSSSTMISEASPSSSIDDKTVYKSLAKETRAVEKLAKEDQRKAKAERAKESFFDYEAKMAEEQEARIESAEQKAIDEAIKDKKEFERLRAQELKIEEEAARAETKQEKEARLKEAKRLIKEEKQILKKEQKAERAERVFLAEEIQEQKILQKKEALAKAVSTTMTWVSLAVIEGYSQNRTCFLNQEQEKFDKIEKEYERVEKIAEEDEAELRYVIFFRSVVISH